MATIKQIEANRLNATKSTGPRTPQGKSATRLNALKHGLFATDPVIPGEDPANFEALLTSHHEQFQPATAHEHVLLAAMVRDAWSLERSANAETSIWTRAMEGNRGETHPLGRSQQYNGQTLAQVQRRIDSAQRNYRRNLDILLKLQAARPKASPDPETVAEPIQQPKLTQPLKPEIGSVPSYPESPARPRVTF